MDLRKLKELRKQRKISAEEMGKRLGVHRDTINRIEEGDKPTDVHTIIAYVKELGDVELCLMIKA